MIDSMRRTQIQMPEPLYQEVKKLAEVLDWSITEVLRRGAEYMVQCYRIGETEDSEPWSLPPPRAMGDFRASHEHWRELANELREH